MGKKNQSNNKAKGMINGKYYPLVSVCTPTFNRRPFIENMFNCFRNQTYPKQRIQWIIIDDGSDKIKDLVDAANIPQIEYYALDKKVPLGKNRNIMHSYVKGAFVVYMDDDDYYPPERISHAVEVLTENKDALCAGSSEIYIYFKDLKKMIQCGPYGPKHATAGTFAFRAELLQQTKYEDGAALAEEKAFLKNYTVPFVQLDPMKTILVFSHNHNTFDKRRMFENPHPDFFKESHKTVDSFIRNKNEVVIKKFFMEDIDGLLKNYEPGEPKNKPDVMQQIKDIEKHRAEMEKQMASQSGGQKIMLNAPGQPPKEVSIQELVNVLNQNQQQMQMMDARIKEQEIIIQNLQKQLAENKQHQPSDNHFSSKFSKAISDDTRIMPPTPVQTVKPPVSPPSFEIPNVIIGEKLQETQHTTNSTSKIMPENVMHINLSD